MFLNILNNPKELQAINLYDSNLNMSKLTHIEKRFIFTLCVCAGFDHM